MSVCKSVFSVGFGSGLDWSWQGAGTPPAMLRGRMTGFQKMGARASGEAG